MHTKELRIQKPQHDMAKNPQPKLALPRDLTHVHVREEKPEEEEENKK